MLRHEHADLNGLHLHYTASGEGKLIMFAHGFPEFWYGWKDQLNEFGRDYLAVAPDLRGYNLSSKPPDVAQYEVKNLVEDLRALAQHLGRNRFILTGHDWGGIVAWAYALIHPEEIEKLVIINAPHPAAFARELRESPAQQAASLYMLMLRSPQAERILSANNYQVLVETVLEEGLKLGYFTEEDRRAYLEAWSMPGALTGGLNYYRAARAGPPQAEGDFATRNLALDFASFTVRVPTLVIWGEQDRYLLTGNLEGLERYVPDLTIRRVPDGSHWVIHEKPALVNTFIREFIESRR